MMSTPLLQKRRHNNIVIPDENTAAGYDTYIVPLNHSIAYKFGLKHNDIAIKSQVIKCSDTETYNKTISSVISCKIALSNGYKISSDLNKKLQTPCADELIFNKETPHQIIITHYQTTDIIPNAYDDDYYDETDNRNINTIPLFIHHFYGKTH
eukprot:181904_1